MSCNTYDGPLRDQLQNWIRKFRHSEFAFDSPDAQLAGFLANKMQRARPALLNPENRETWKVCYLCRTPMDPQYDPSGAATNGNDCCGGR